MYCLRFEEFEDDFSIFKTKFRLQQGSQTQINRGATFGWKMSLRAAVLNETGSAGRNVEKYAIFIKDKFGHILLFFVFH